MSSYSSYKMNFLLTVAHFIFSMVPTSELLCSLAHFDGSVMSSKLASIHRRREWLLMAHKCHLECVSQLRRSRGIPLLAFDALMTSGSCTLYAWDVLRPLLVIFGIDMLDLKFRIEMMSRNMFSQLRKIKLSVIFLSKSFLRFSNFSSA